MLSDRARGVRPPSAAGAAADGTAPKGAAGGDDAALDYTVIPAVTLQGADVMAALSAWARESRGHNSHRTPFFYACSVATPAPGPDGVVPAPARITLSLKNVTSRRLLDEICRQGGLVWWVERKTIMIGPPGSAPGNRP